MCPPCPEAQTLVRGLPLPQALPQRFAPMGRVSTRVSGGLGGGWCLALQALFCPHLLEGSPGGPGAEEWAQGQGHVWDPLQMFYLQASQGTRPCPHQAWSPARASQSRGDVALENSGPLASHALGSIRAEATLLGGPSAKASVRFLSQIPLLGALTTPLQSDSVLVLLPWPQVHKTTGDLCLGAPSVCTPPALPFHGRR